MQNCLNIVCTRCWLRHRPVRAILPCQPHAAPSPLPSPLSTRPVTCANNTRGAGRIMSATVISRRWARVEVPTRQRAARCRPDARRNGRQAPPPAPPSPLPPPARAPADRAKASGSSSLITSRRLSCRRRRGTLPKAIRGWPTRWCSSRCSSQPCSGSGSLHACTPQAPAGQRPALERACEQGAGAHLLHQLGRNAQSGRASGSAPPRARPHPAGRQRSAQTPRQLDTGKPCREAAPCASRGPRWAPRPSR